MTAPVDLESIGAAASAVRQTAYEVVLVGAGAFLALGFPATTYDVDLCARRRDFEHLGRKLADLGWRIEIAGNALAATREGFYPVAILHPDPFGPPATPDHFFEYLLAKGSAETSVGRAALPAAVWYMRLAFEPETGRQKILEEAQLELFDALAVLAEVEELAYRMERLPEIAEHLAWLRGHVPKAGVP